jgi:hypothetical protein
LKKLRETDPEARMPPKHPLSVAEIAAFEQWIRLGAPDPRNGVVVSKAVDWDEAGKHWAFQPLKISPPPTQEGQGGDPTVLDAFVRTELNKQGLRPNPPADRTTLMRRVTFDLTGLPPTPEEITAFLDDPAADDAAFAALVDRLLASPAYGERWGRHWLDVARYADTAGDGADYPVREARLYRDWVVRAFNADRSREISSPRRDLRSASRTASPRPAFWPSANATVTNPRPPTSTSTSPMRSTRWGGPCSGCPSAAPAVTTTNTTPSARPTTTRSTAFSRARSGPFPAARNRNALPISPR